MHLYKSYFVLVYQATGRQLSPALGRAVLPTPPPAQHLAGSRFRPWIQQPIGIAGPHDDGGHVDRGPTGAQARTQVPTAALYGRLKEELRLDTRDAAEVAVRGARDAAGQIRADARSVGADGARPGNGVPGLSVRRALGGRRQRCIGQRGRRG